MKILFVGDAVGNPGRRAVGKMLATLRADVDADFVLLNGENAASGLGITRPTAQALFDAGVDVITLGNHTFAKRDVASYLDEEPRILRPANYPPGVPGRGWGVFRDAAGRVLSVVSLLGRTFMVPIDCPFRTADAVLAEIADQAKTVLVDFHAEATSERVAMGWYLDGRATAVIGTHTHVQTSDERVLPKGTAYITDVGMTGVRDSVLGMDVAHVINRFKTQVPARFTLAEGAAVLQAALVELNADSGAATSISRITLNE